MKYLSSLIILLLFCSINSFGQETFRKRYYVKKSYSFKKPKRVVELQKDTLIKYNNANPKEKAKADKEYVMGDKVMVTKSTELNGQAVTISKEVVINDTFFDSLKVPRKLTVTNCKSKASLLFKENKIFVNPWVLKEEIYYLELKNRQTIKIPFFEWTVNTMTLPLKYRFKNEDDDISEEFTTAFNVNLFGGFSFGTTKFFHRKKVGNKTINRKITLGALLGASTVELNSSNTSAADDPLGEGVKITKGLRTLGIGAVYSYNKINFGLFIGSDKSIGKDAKKWNYNNSLWFGVGLGYSLFSF